MVYGRTLHLIDEESIRREFVPRLLDTESRRERAPERGFSFFGLRWGAPPERPILDLKRPPSTRRWRNMRLILEKRDPLDAARCLSELAIRFASKELPYGLVDERHVVLSNWDDCLPEGMPDLPDHLLPSLDETLFRDVVAAYPRVAGYFRVHFDGEPSPGVFVPAANVAPLLAWLRDDGLAVLDANQRRAFRTVLNVLEIAQEHGYAYWEATGLNVKESSARVFERTPPPPPKELRTHVSPEVPAGWYTSFWGPLGRLRIVGTRGQRTAATVCLDFGTWPPREVGRPAGLLAEPALSRDDRLLAMRYMPSESNYELGYFYRSFEDRTWQSLVLDVDQHALGTPRLGWIGERAVAVFPSPRDQEPRLFVQDGDRLVPGPALPPLRPGGPSSEKLHTPRAGFVNLTSGETLLIWDGYAYRLDASGLTRRFDLGAPTDTGPLRTTATPDGGFFFLSSSRLYELRADGAVVRHAPDIGSIGHVTPGPQGMLLLRQGTNPEADIGKIYDPKDGSYASLTREMFGFSETDDSFDSIFWSRAAELIVIMDEARLHALPTRVVLDLPRRVTKA